MKPWIDPSRFHDFALRAETRSRTCSPAFRVISGLPPSGDLNDVNLILVRRGRIYLSVETANNRNYDNRQHHPAPSDFGSACHAG